MKKTRKKKKESAERAAQRVYKKNHAVYERVNIITIIAVFIFAGLCLVLLNRPTESESEKRTLAEKPTFSLASFMSGEYTSDFTTWFSDTVPAREALVSIASWISDYFGVATPTFYGDVAVVADDNGVSLEVVEEEAIVTEVAIEELELEDEIAQATEEEQEEEQVIATVEEEEEEEEFVGDISDFTNNGIIVDGVEMYGDTAGVMLFGGSTTAGKRYAEVISAYKEDLGDDVTVYNMVVPTSVEFYLPKKYKKYSASQWDSIETIYSSYTADVISIDAYSEIAQHTDEYIYLRTDHHWSQRGAYYAYKAFATILGQDVADIDDTDAYETGTKEGFVGSLYSYTNDTRLKNAPEIFTYYKPTSEYTAYYYDYKTLEETGTGTLFYDLASGSNCYGMFLGGDALHVKAVTGLNTGRKIAVFKESYGNAFIPFLVDSFDEIYVIDIRYFGTNAVQFIKDNGITDVLFLNNAFAANTDSLIDCIEKLRTNPYGSLDEPAVVSDSSNIPSEYSKTEE